MSEKKYSKDHEWVLIENEIATVGITNYAQESLGDIVFIELPEIGRLVKSGEQIGVVESVKAASDLFSPISGNVIESNTALNDHPELVNEDPFGEGWLIRVTISSVNELDGLMSASGYQSYINGL